MDETHNAEAVEIGLGAQLKGRVTIAHKVIEELLAHDFDRLGLTPGEADVLTVLLIAKDQTLAPTELANWLGLTTAGMTARLNTLEERGLVERRNHASDGRRRTLHFTPEGLELAESVMRLKDDIITERVIATLGQQRAEQLLSDLADVITAATDRGVPRPTY